MASIYCLSCLDTGKKYIGSTRKDLNWRVDIHYQHSKTLNTKLYTAMRQHRFLYGLFEEVKEEERYEREAYWIKKFNTLKEGYNTRLPGKGFVRPYQYQRKNISDMNTKETYIRHKYRLYAPDGQVFDASSMGLVETLLGMNKKGLYRVAKGERRQNLGWRAEIIDSMP